VPEGVGIIIADPTTRGRWQDKVAENEVIINLAGDSIFRRWSSKAKQEIVNSRILTTRNLVDALACRKHQETHFFSASGIGYYGFHGDDLLDENAIPGTDFIATLAARWESAAMGAGGFGTRVVLCRLGHVLGAGGSVLPKLITLSKLRLGSHWGSGRQWISWIHEDDMARVFLYLLERRDIVGPINVTAPHPVRNREMMDLLSQFLETQSLAPPVPGFVLRLLTGEFATVFLEGQRVVPRRLLESGFRFKYPSLNHALKEVLCPSQ
jgi:uncharacterized protein (TIGR01777 family)